MPTQMEALLLATGFTGALTLRWLFGLILARSPGRIVPHFVPGVACADLIAKEIAAARNEVVLLASVFTCRPIAQALVDARLRGVTVEVILDGGNETDPGSELHFLVDQGLPPMLDDKLPIGHNLVVVDGGTVLTGGFTFAPQPDSPIPEHLLVVYGDRELASAYRQEFVARKTHARAVPAKTATPAPVQEDIVASVAQNLVEDQALSAETPADPRGPTVTAASAELFHRLRKELAEGGEEPEKPGKNKKKAG